jgi:acylpyruvate hydrolase
MIIRNLWCVGRNYSDHAKELGNEVPKTPLIFLKAGTCTLNSGFPLVLPTWSSDIHHEVELALQFGDGLKIVRGCIALDLTLRDIQTELKKNVHPWTLAKSFKNAAPLGSFFEIENLQSISDLKLRLTVNGEVRQEARVSEMVFPPETLATYVIERFPVTSGDLLLTGTPKGVGPVQDGDELIAEVLQLQDGKEQSLSLGQWTATFE